VQLYYIYSPLHIGVVRRGAGVTDAEYNTNLHTLCMKNAITKELKKYSHDGA